MPGRKVINLIGQQFNSLLVLDRDGRDSTGKTTWKCICTCGEITTVTGLNLKSSNTKSCGCAKERPQHLDITGQKFNRLTAISIFCIVKGVVTWKCKCDCGSNSFVTYGHLQSNHTKSCGCWCLEVASAHAKKNLAGKSGKDHPLWNPLLSDEDRVKFRPKIINWRKAVFERDNYTCAICTQKGSSLNAHHLNCWADFPEQRYDIDNGVTLCKKCHKNFHDSLGGNRKTCTREHYYAFKETLCKS